MTQSHDYPFKPYPQPCDSPNYFYPNQITSSPEPNLGKKYHVPKQQPKQGSEQGLQKKMFMQQQQIQQQDKQDEIFLLKQHLKVKYPHYSDQQIDEIIQKFINEYLKKNNLSLSDEKDQIDQEQEEQDNDGNDTDSLEEGMDDFPDQDDLESRASLSTNLDWNDKGEIERYCKKQLRIQEEKDFRPSQYFGAIQVEQLEDGIDDSRIDDLFLDCFGIKPQKKKKKEQRKKENIQPQSAQLQNPQQQQMQVKVQAQGQKQPIQSAYSPQLPINQLVPKINNSKGSAQQKPNDQSCKIILNIFNQFQIMNQENNQKDQNQNIKHQQDTSHKEDQYATILQEKPKNQSSKNNCQILHQEQQSYNTTSHNSNQCSVSDNSKKFMSPVDIPKHVKGQSEQMELDNNDFQKCCYKTDDNRPQLQGINVKAQPKSYQTQINSPQSMGNINRHLYNQSITSSSNLVGVNSSIQSLSHQSSHGNLTINNNISKVKHQSNLSLNKQAYKSILYKHQNPNFHSISSNSSIENKPKQMNKLSYLVAKQLPENLQQQQLQLQQQQQDGCHTRMNSNTSVLGAPKPPSNQSQQLNQKMGRNSKEGNQPYNYIPYYDQNDLCEHSPQVSPKQTLLQIHNNQQPTQQVNHFKLNSQTFTMQHANQTFQSGKNPLQQSVSKDLEYNPKTLVQQSIENFKKAKQSVQQMTNHSIVGMDGSNSQRGKTSRTLGRNQSQNLFKSSHTINSVQSFLMSSGDPHKGICKDSLASDNLDSLRNINSNEQDEKQISPQIFTSKYDHPAFTSNNTSRPQTAINSNFSLASGINQYVNNASNLGKPPSKLSKGFLSHNSSAKNLKIQKNNMTLQTAQNSSRKKNNQLQLHQTSIQADFLNTVQAQSTRNAPSGQFKFGKNDLDNHSKEREKGQAKSIERHKIKTSLLQQQYDQDVVSLERKRQLYKNQKAQHQQQQVAEMNKFYSGNHKVGDKKQSSQIGRNQSGISKGKSAAMAQDFLNPQKRNDENNKADSATRTVLKINKSLEKISNITKNFNINTSNAISSIVSSPTNQFSIKQLNHPQSTKNAKDKQKINEMLAHMSSYQSYMKKAKNEATKEELKSLKGHKTSIHQQQQQHTTNNSKTRKQEVQISNIDFSQFSKKTAETYKRYLTSGGQSTTLQNQLNSFK